MALRRGLLDEVLADTWAQTSGHGQGKAPPETDEGAFASIARLRARRIVDGNRVPEEWLRLRAPLLLESIGARSTCRAAEIESAEPIAACGANRLPVEEHVGTLFEVFGQARRPRHRHHVIGGERDE